MTENRVHSASRGVTTETPIVIPRGVEGPLSPPAQPSSRPRGVKPLRIAAFVLLVCVLLLAQAGGYSVVDNSERSDAIVVLWGNEATERYLHGLELLRPGYGSHLVVVNLAE